MKTRDEKIATHLANRLVLLKTKPTKKEWMKMVEKAETVVDNLTQGQNVATPSAADEVPHRAYTLAMNRKAHRHACMVTAQTVGEIDWKYTKADWTSLRAGDDGETMFVSVRMAIPKTEYERVKRQYIRLQIARVAKANKGEKK